jgi:hypothetical protein
MVKRQRWELADEGLWATWFCWWGSRELVAHVARKALEALEAVGPKPASCAIIVTVGEDCERFTSPNDFLLGASNEALARFICLEVLVRTDEIAVHVTFDRRGRGRSSRGGEQVVHLEVWSTDLSGRWKAVEVARKVAVSLSRGYARYWARCEASADLTRQVGRSLPGRALLTAAATVAAGGLLGAGVVRLFDDVPGMVISSHAAVLLLAATGMGYQALVTRLVSNVEIAREGRTRLRAIARHSVPALVSLVATQLLPLIFN